MDSYRMNCRNVSGNCRNRTCGNLTGNRESMIPMDSTSKTCTNPCDRMQETSIQEHLQKLPLAMAYVPMQKFGKVYEPARGFQLGTIFRNFANRFVEKEVDAGDDGTKQLYLPGRTK